ncbi:MAG: glutamate-5-semialdehyde dehydrogenase [Candidatus Saganbacteria bacterium]|nr:glutamate-5-semialdehyde dehydrogenase [Candidatus Saganbacteria bacterium]
MKKETEIKAKNAALAARLLAVAPAGKKNAALKKMAEALKENSAGIMSANEKDVKSGIRKGLSNALIDRLALDQKRIDEMCKGLDIVIGLPDPVGEVIEEWTRPNGLRIKKVRVPIGTIAIIYEARPNVTVDAAGLCIKAGNCVILRGGSDAVNTNSCIAKIISDAASSAGLPKSSIEFIKTTERSAVKDLLGLRQYIDCVIPRGGAGLINMVVENSRVPVIETGVGNCHAYVEESADLKMAEDVVFNAKVQRPSVCNAIETLLVDEKIAGVFLPKMLERLKATGVEIRGCKKTKAIDKLVKNAVEKDWYTEYLDLILAVKVVSGLDEAIEHISKYGSHHSETILTKDAEKAKAFTSKIDSAALYVNASTRFTDGGEFGFGAEIGISTQKLHARGPMGLKELTTYKYIVEGNGQCRV